MLKATITASRSLSDVNQACSRLPDPGMLISLIPLMESRASNEIENIVTTNDELFQASNDILTDMTPQLKEAMRYTGALHAGCESLSTRPITTHTAKQIRTHIRGHEAEIRDRSGTYIGDPRTRERIYTPPEGRDVIMSHLAAWESFLHSDTDLDPLVIMALAHYQFEAIHPFHDGNGRTGRIFNLLILIEKGLLRQPILYLSGHILRHKDVYYRRLQGVTRRGEWEPWILFMLDGVREIADWTLRLIDDTQSLQEEMASRIRTKHPHMPPEALCRLAFATPYLRIDNIVAEDLAGRQTAAKWLNSLAEDGLLTKRKIGRRNIYINQRLLDRLFTTPLSG